MNPAEHLVAAVGLKKYDKSALQKCLKTKLRQKQRVKKNKSLEQQTCKRAIKTKRL